jgi:hypothetical protein
MWCWVGVAAAEPLRGAVIVEPSVSVADVRGELGARLGSPTGSQVGLDLRWAEVDTAWIDGWPVSDGTAVSALVHGAAPLVRAERLRIDLRADVGGRRLAAREVAGPDDRSWALLTEVGPRATLPLAEPVSAWVGFTNVVDFQLDPSFATDGLGQILDAGLVWAPSDDWQLAAHGEAGGLYGYDGDGAKFAARVAVSLRLVPGAARTWTWL